MSDEVDYPRAIGELVYKLRKTAGLSQEGLAGSAGLDRRWVLWLEKRQLRLDDLDKLTRLARKLGLSPAEFWGRVVMPEKDAAELEKEARKKFSHDLYKALDKQRQRYLTALDDEPRTAQLLQALSVIAAGGTKDELELVAAMLEAAMMVVYVRQQNRGGAGWRAPMALTDFLEWETGSRAVLFDEDPNSE